MAASILTSMGLTPFCPESELRHADIRASNPTWCRCGFCGQVFPRTEGTAQQSAQTFVSEPSLPPAASLTPAASLSQQPAQSVVSLQSSPATPSSMQRPFNTGALQPVNPTDGALTTHIARPGPLSLMGATQTGRQQRNASLANLERDRAALTRQPDPLTRPYLVTMTFFVAEYHLAMYAGIPTKEYGKLRKVRHTPPRALQINDVFPDETSLLRWLFDKLHVSTADLGDKGPEQWRVATSVIIGSSNKPGSWDPPSWDQHDAIQLYQYKSMVHDADGKEKDARRIPLICGGAPKIVKRYLGVFAVHEHCLSADLEAENDVYDQPFKPHGQEEQSQRPALHPALTLHQTVGPPTSHTPVYDLEDENLFVTQPSSSSASQLGLQRRGRLDSVQSVAVSSNLATHGRRPSSTAPSSVDLHNIALSSLALCRSSASDALAAVGHQSQHAAAFDEQWIHSPDRDELLQHTTDGEGGGFVQPADLEAGAGEGHGVGHEQVEQTSDTGFLEESEGEVVVALVPKKRKRPSPRTACADGKPKPKKSKKAGQSKKTASVARPQQPGIVGTRQSDRLQARALA